jgi:hypothetical protein
LKVDTGRLALRLEFRRDLRSLVAYRGLTHFELC